MIRTTGNEHFDKLWEYWMGLTHNGSRKQDALKYFEGHSAGDQERFANELISAIGRVENLRNEKMAAKEFVPQWCALAVYINEKRYMDDVIDPKEKEQIRNKLKNWCEKHPNRESHHNFPPFRCQECVAREAMRTDPIAQMMRDYYREHNLGEMPMEDVIALCKKNADLFELKIG